jgi:hypothetical protein
MVSIGTVGQQPAFRIAKFKLERQTVRSGHTPLTFVAARVSDLTTAERFVL